MIRLKDASWIKQDEIEQQQLNGNTTDKQLPGSPPVVPPKPSRDGGMHSRNQSESSMGIFFFFFVVLMKVF